METYKNIPLIKQKDNNSCIPACTVMLLKSAGIEKTQEDIEKEIPERITEKVPVVGVTNYLKQHGFDVICFSYNMYYFDSQTFKPKDNSELIAKIEEITQQQFFKESEYHMQQIELFLKALRSNVLCKIERPSVEQITQALSENYNIVAVVNTALWYGFGYDPVTAHAVLIVDATDENFICIDPGYGRTAEVRKDKMLFYIEQQRIVSRAIYMFAVKRSV